MHITTSYRNTIHGFVPYLGLSTLLYDIDFLGGYGASAVLDAAYLGFVIPRQRHQLLHDGAAAAMALTVM